MRAQYFFLIFFGVSFLLSVIVYIFSCCLDEPTVSLLNSWEQEKRKMLYGEINESTEVIEDAIGKIEGTLGAVRKNRMKIEEAVIALIEQEKRVFSPEEIASLLSCLDGVERSCSRMANTATGIRTKLNEFHR